MNVQDRQTTRPHYLLTALGIRSQMTTYSLNGVTAEAGYSPLALLKLLNKEDRPDAVLCLLTTKAREKVWGDFAQKVKQLGVIAKPIDIPDVDDSVQMTAMVQVVAREIVPHSRLTLDITQGPRHIPFVFYALALYLSGFHDVEITSIWYGSFESDAPDKPLINLRSLLDLPQWLYAVKVFRETGFTKALAQCFTNLQKNLPKGPERGPSAKAAEALRRFSMAYESGLPMELGLAAGKLCHGLEKTPLQETPGLSLPLAKELGQSILESASSLRFDTDRLKDGQSKGLWKTTAHLCPVELQRQAHLIDQYLVRDQIPLALELMREWVVSLGALHRGKSTDWLKRSVRIEVEHELGAMSQPALQKYLDEEQREWGSFWDQLGQQRNHIAHCGMNQNVANNTVEPLLKYWQTIKAADEAWSSFGGGNGQLLVTPLGMSPGVLFSALEKVQPDSVLVLCSEQAKPGIDEALQQAECPKNPHTLIMQDPFNGFDEIKTILENVRKTCLSADEIVINLTGGTTMMGIAVQRIYEQARNDQRPCRRFVLTDQRLPEEQRRKPWVEADIHWLDESSNQGEGHD